MTDSTGFPALRNGLDVLRTFDATHDRLGVVEIAERTGLHKSTVSRMLVVLEEEGLVERDEESRKYSLGLGLVLLAGPLLGSLDVGHAARRPLRHLRDVTGESAALVRWAGSVAVVIEQMTSRHDIAHVTPVGARYATALSACVQVFLADQPPSRVDARITAGTIDLPGADDGALEGLHALLEEGRDTGVFINDRRTSADVIGLAAPVHDHRGDLAAAVLLAAPAHRVGADGIGLLACATREAAEQTSRALGYVASPRPDGSVHLPPQEAGNSRVGG